jgi:mannose-6-phosphate isomerase-like protein (cupin superfamily)
LSSSEVYYIIEGRGEMHIDDDCAVLESGDLVEIPPGAVQWIRNVGETDLVFLCIVDPAWCAEDEEILK